ncbi:UPF0755 protein [Natranaerovirga pectinivora]|uniref:Endolytic murein transglycosylase n=1 Tax=Natranaerovirga pectinivora TaxID=682400 RepID=A0A4R3MRR6_9FIRM|nr:endolytic transglycosylase MltG [Natranaerovirga pectinivora]TCT16888.1 UPF0755 protein [Natranaerovirga pectinivora]
MGKKVMHTTLRMILKILFLILAVYLIYVVGTKSYSAVYDFILGEPDPNVIVRDVTVSIPQGANTKAIGEILQENGLIKNANLFMLRVKFLSEFDGKLRYGDFTLNTGMSEEEMILVLSTEGQRRATVRFTIPEGFTIQQMARKLEDDGIVTAEEFMDAVNNTEYDYRFLKDLPEREPGEPRLQGYLFPDTYEVFEGSSADVIVSRMLSGFNNVFTDEYYKRADELGYTVDEIVTIAAMIEKEARVAEERPMIAGVIYNRIAVNMLLQIDATLQYLRERYPEDDPRRIVDYKDYDSRYNTYRFTGIPSGPIANPGRSSIEGALYPESHEYFYYVLRDPVTGEHAFNRTLEEHNRDVNRYLR